MRKNFIPVAILFSGAIVLIALILVLNLKNVHKGDSFVADTQTNQSIKPVSQCQVQGKEMTVQGYSMYPYIVPDEKVKALFGYYGCHAIQRGDVVLYDYSGDKNLLIKFVKAVPGDQWSLKEDNGSYEIVVNGSSLVNSEGKLYLVSDYKMLKLYTDSYPTIPADTYLILGDETNGSLDSTHFGLVSGGDIEAKVVLEE